MTVPTTRTALCNASNSCTFGQSQCASYDSLMIENLRVMSCTTAIFSSAWSFGNRLSCQYSLETSCRPMHSSGAIICNPQNDLYNHSPRISFPESSCIQYMMHSVVDSRAAMALQSTSPTIRRETNVVSGFPCLAACLACHLGANVTGCTRPDGLDGPNGSVFAQAMVTERQVLNWYIGNSTRTSLNSWA